MLERTRIDSLKGVLILIIVAGHNEALMHHALEVRQLFYYFNVQCFLFLAMVLPCQSLTLDFVIDRAVRYLVPYFIFVLLAALLYLPINGMPLGFLGWVCGLSMALFSGNETELNQVVGIRLFWFLPSLFSLILLRSLALRGKKWDRGLMVLSGIWVCVGGLVPGGILSSIPLGLPVSLFFYLPGRLIQIGMEHVTKRGLHSGLFTALILVAVLMASWILRGAPGWVAGASPSTYPISAPATFVAGLVFPVVVFFTLFGLCRWLQHLPLLARCGQLSLIIYLLHVFVYRGLAVIFYGRDFSNFNVVANDLLGGWVLFLLSCVLCLLAGVFLQKMPVVQALIFPRNLATWKTTLQKCFKYGR